jgi:predicted membrane chloride channel (bestrophin family)
VLGAVLNSLTVGCFLGIHETARELERPFQSPPNDLPLTTFQAQLCESLISVYAAYNPNLFWQLKESDAAAATVGNTDNELHDNTS